MLTALMNWKTQILIATHVAALALGAIAGWREHAKQPLPACPTCPEVTADAHVKVEPQTCTSHESIQYVYVPVKSSQPGCPDIAVPVPRVDVDHTAIGPATDTTASAVARPPPDAPSVVPPLQAVGALPRWRATALLGGGPDGVLVGAAVGFRLVGPLEVGAWILTPRSQLQPMGGMSLGVSW